jgi:hypothetical protein
VIWYAIECRCCVCCPFAAKCGCIKPQCAEEHESLTASGHPEGEQEEGA